MVHRVEVTEYGDRPDDTAWRSWAALLEGDTERALKEMNDIYQREVCDSTMISYGAIMLNANAYGAAYDHFFKVIKMSPCVGESEYSFAGVAQWCLGNVGGAIKIWKEGMDAPYAPGGICIQTPMLLLAASILKPGSIARGEAESALAAKANNPKSDRWPYTLAHFLLGGINAECLEASKHGHIGRRNVEGNLRHRTWMIEFYKNLSSIGRNGYCIEDFRELMKAMTNLTTEDWKEPENFAILARQAEYFIARHAARQT